MIFGPVRGMLILVETGEPVVSMGDVLTNYAKISPLIMLSDAVAVCSCF